ncbi:DedA family protein [Candidatus Woesearchaeota archaeon]|nr:DedA family protein [Candidatus Woesearchaeota archaeon]
MVFGFIFEYIVSVIDKLGYVGIFVFMVLESMVFPIPSEAIMPFAGFLVAQGRLNLYLVIALSALASLIGSLLSYYMGYFGGRKFVHKFGRYFFINEGHLIYTEKFFKNYGEKTIFVGRFIPVVRHLISVPAGIGKMNLIKFSLYTILGAGIWNTFILYIGFFLNEKWELVKQYSSKIDIFIIIIVALFIIYYIYKFLNKNKIIIFV